MRANERTDERVALYLRLYSCLFQTTVDRRHLPGVPPEFYLDEADKSRRWRQMVVDSPHINAVDAETHLQLAALNPTETGTMTTATTMTTTTLDQGPPGFLPNFDRLFVSAESGSPRSSPERLEEITMTIEDRNNQNVV